MESNNCSLRRYFCHKCERQTSVDEQDSTCTRCHDGFIEELDSSMEPATSFSDDHELFRQISENPTISVQLPSSSPGNLDFIVQRLLETMIGPDRFSSFLGMIGNPNDYAMGQVDFDNIVTQMLSRLENNGPPPATDEEIELINDIEISQDDVNQQLSCSVCLHEYNLDEKVAKLVCTHLFHRECITQWLKRHGTCPICRKTLSGTDASSSETYPDGGASTSPDELFVAIAENFLEEEMRQTRSGSSQGRNSAERS